MAGYQLVIRNATVATAADVMQCDVGITDGRIAALARGLAPGDTEIDAAGMLALPGGVDAHCHLDQPMPDGIKMADDFASGTISAACGGTTTVIPFAVQEKGRSLIAAVEDYHRRANGKAIVDYAFHLIVSDPSETVLREELPELIRQGYTSFKLYMTYDDLKLNDRQILDVLALARREGALAMIHAENSDCIAWLTEQLEAAGNIAPRFHALSRPGAVEREATQRAITLAQLIDVPILIVHVSGAEAIEQIRWARARGLRIYAETCPQYLLLTADDLDRPGYEGAKCVCSPPPRDKFNQEAVWNGLSDGLFDIVSSDHAPFRYAGMHGKKPGGKEVAFHHIPNGIPGIETRLPLLYTEGVGRGRIDVNQFVALTATNPAKMYGLYPRKGTIAIGADADIALWDTHKEVTITNAQLHHNCDYTPYEGRKLRGWPVVTLARGDIVWRDGQVKVAAGRGQFLRCGLPEPARHRSSRRELGAR